MPWRVESVEFEYSKDAPEATGSRKRQQQIAEKILTILTEFAILMYIDY